MTPTISNVGEDFIEAVLKRIWPQAFLHMSRLPYSELFRTLAVLDRQDVKDLSSQISFAKTAAPSGAQSLAKIGYALETVLSGKRPARSPEASKTLIAKRCLPSELGANDYLLNVVAGQRIPLFLKYDFTFTIPVEVSHPTRLSEDDFVSAAKQLDVEVAAIKAVAAVEVSQSGGFQDGHRPTLRYELHKFQERTNGGYHQTHPWLSQPSLQLGDRYHTRSQDQEYSLLFNAMLLGGFGNRTVRASLSSASYGRFQVMGFNAEDCGWPNVQNFVLDMFLSEANQLKAFIAMVQSKHLSGALRSHDWVKFARGYNGPNYGDYNQRIEDKYNDFVSMLRN